MAIAIQRLHVELFTSCWEKFCIKKDCIISVCPYPVSLMADPVSLMADPVSLMADPAYNGWGTDPAHDGRRVHSCKVRTHYF